MFYGILTGLASAFFQDCGYILSSFYVKSGKSAVSLLVFTQILMGIAGVVILPFLVGSASISGGWIFLLPLLGASFGSLGGQYFFFRAEKSIEPSRLSSLIGLRVLVVALFTAVFLGERYDALQIAGLALAGIAALMLNWQRGKFRLEGMGAVVLTLVCYGVSDMSIGHLVHSFHTPNLIRSSLLAMSLVNILLGLVALPFFLKMERKRLIGTATPFAAIWLIKQICLYLCYAQIGPVLGNVIMALRGPIAILLALLLISMGIRTGKYGTISRGTWICRIVATLMMCAAIILFLLSGNVKIS